MEHDNSKAAEILNFMAQVFPNCNIAPQYYPEDKAWKFMFSFITNNTRSFIINPPKGCCLLSVHAVGQNISFHLVLFVHDFIQYHQPVVAN